MSTIIDSLIYDRTQADVDRVFTLKNKILTEGLSSLSVEEKAEYMGGMKGAYNYGDLNRIGLAVEHIATRMTSLPEELAEYRAQKGVADDPIYDVPYDPSSVVVSPKTDWVMGDTPTQAQAQTFLTNLNTLRRQLSLPEEAPPVPSSLDGLTFTTANQIEYLLLVIDRTLTEVEDDLYHKIDMTVAAFAYANTYHSGE